MKKFFAAAMVFLFLQPQAWGQVKATSGDLRSIDASIKTIKTLQDQQIITPQVGKSATDFYLSKAAKIVGHEVKAEDISGLINDNDALVSKITGLITFSNILWVFAGILLAIAIVWLAGTYLATILSLIPSFVYELMCYGTVGWMFYSGNMWLMFPACLLLPGCLLLTNYLHGKPEFRVGPFTYVNLANLLCVLVYGVTAWYHGSELMGFLCIFALFCFLGFTAIVSPLCYFIGYTREEFIPRTMSAAFILLVSYISYVVLQRPELDYFYKVFGNGILSIGTFVYFVSLLIVSSWYYNHGRRYWFMQILTVLSGIAALYFGSVYDIGMLQGIGGTFFFLYVIEKYFEIPWRKVGWAWSLLGLAGGLYWFAGFVANHPEYFLLGLGK